jgi:site-specific DNA-methyltransferase (adenine-specific)
MKKHFDSTTGKNDWETPPKVFSALDKLFKFTLDPCATKKNAKCKKYYTKKDDGLTKIWSGRVFVNPPYGREIYSWIKKARQESILNCEIVVTLLPARTDNYWWHEFVMTAKEIWFTKGRIIFFDKGKVSGGSTFGSVVVIFDKKKHRFPKIKSWNVRKETL